MRARNKATRRPTLLDQEGPQFKGVSTQLNDVDTGDEKPREKTEKRATTTVTTKMKVTSAKLKLKNTGHEEGAVGGVDSREEVEEAAAAASEAEV